MTDALPPPPLPPEVDLRDRRYMPLLVGNLLGSDTWLIASGDEAKAMVTLWARAWHQVPAGSLPDDDRLLSALSGAGAKWPKLRKVALRGFVKHDDGRLYHPVIVEQARAAWGLKDAQRARTEAARAARHRAAKTDVTDTVTEPVTTSVTEPVTESVTGSKGREGKKERKKESYPETADSTIRAARDLIETFDRVLVETYGAEHERPWPQAADSVHAQRAIDAGWTLTAAEALFRDRLVKRRAQNKPAPGGLAWFERAFAEASPEARSSDEPGDDDPRVKRYVAAVDAYLALDADARRKAQRPRREEFGLPPGPPAPKAAA